MYGLPLLGFCLEQFLARPAATVVCSYTRFYRVHTYTHSHPIQCAGRCLAATVRALAVLRLAVLCVYAVLGESYNAITHNMRQTCRQLACVQLDKHTYCSVGPVCADNTASAAVHSDAQLYMLSAELLCFRLAITCVCFWW